MTWATLPVDDRARLLQRGLHDIFEPSLRASIERIIDDVRANGDEAVCRALRDFDGVIISPDSLRVTEDEFAAANDNIDGALSKAVDHMIANIRRFNEEVMARHAQDWWVESEPGLFIGEKVTPIASAALFCPAGKASYPSVLAQLGGPAVVAGVARTVVITPPTPRSAGVVDLHSRCCRPARPA